MGQLSRKAADPLAAARETLAAPGKLIHDLESQRRDALIGDDDGLVQRLSGRLDGLYKQRQIDSDRVQARTEEAERQQRAKAERERLAQIGRIENRLRERDRIGAELAAHIAAADAAFVKLVETSRQVRAAWEWSNSDIFAALITDGTITAAVANEVFRTGGRPPATGGMLDTRPPSYPGGVPETLQVITAPERSTPLMDRLAAASAAASRILRTGANDPPAGDTRANIRTAGTSEATTSDTAPATVMPSPNGSNGDVTPKPAPNPERDRLLERQNELALLDTVEAETEYAANTKRIAVMS
jgi:hypothetical protein